MPTIKESVSHERRTQDSVTFFQVSTYLKFPEKSVQPSPTLAHAGSTT